MNYTKNQNPILENSQIIFKLGISQKLIWNNYQINWKLEFEICKIPFWTRIWLFVRLNNFALKKKKLDLRDVEPMLIEDS